MRLLQTIKVISVLVVFGLAIQQVKATPPAVTVPPAVTAPPAVAVSIPPLHSLVAAVMEGVGKPALLSPGGTSPHRTMLRPSTARHLAEAGLVFWVGPELETFLETPLKRLSEKSGAKITALLHAPGMLRRRARHLHRNADSEAHNPDANYQFDPHFWLDPENAIQIVAIVAEQLGEANPERAAIYRQNRDRTIARLRALDLEMRRKLAPLAGIPYLVFHDSYAYLEGRYDLGPSQAVAIDPERRAGPRRIVALRRKITENAFRCLFHEPQFTAPILARLREGSGISTAQLDPLGSGLTPGPDLYFQMMQTNATSLQNCLKPARDG